MAGRGYKDRAIMQKAMNNMNNRSQRKKVCAVCGKEFVTSMPNQKYCSLVCREAARKAARRAFDEANPNYRKEYMRGYRERQKAH